MGSYKGRTGSSVARSSGGAESHDKAEEMVEHGIPSVRPSKVDTGKQKMLSAYPLDTSDMELPDEEGPAKIGGGVDYLGHSLTGASVVARGNSGHKKG